MLKKVQRIIEYCSTLADRLPAVSGLHIVADEEQGTGLLNNPALFGPQVVIALPMASLTGNCDATVGQHSLIIFAVEKAKSATATQSSLVEQYLAMSRLLETILTRLLDDIAEGAGGGCPLLAGMEFVEVVITPEAGRFGGWNGWSATITLK